ncbi:hypothetical protein IW261DRAFT_1595137 [Armillaria novae-zelandiae]|uniref:Uncharacterized protein n=1 Tax=Armillaria novae-zelandiae TaxID=153914 RepID=A0AA39TAG9_9AGAR|nr:hypothetical protein IW261DRAFT_1595137 [Armillaria novae-zelandiae]
MTVKRSDKVSHLRASHLNTKASKQHLKPRDTYNLNAGLPTDDAKVSVKLRQALGRPSFNLQQIKALERSDSMNEKASQNGIFQGKDVVLRPGTEEIEIAYMREHEESDQRDGFGPGSVSSGSSNVDSFRFRIGSSDSDLVSNSTTPTLPKLASSPCSQIQVPKPRTVPRSPSLDRPPERMPDVLDRLGETGAEWQKSANCEIAKRPPSGKEAGFIMSMGDGKVWLGLDGCSEESQDEDLGRRLERGAFTSSVTRRKIAMVLSSTECELTMTSDGHGSTPGTFTAGNCRANQKDGLGSEKTKRIVFGYCHRVKHVRRSVYSITVSQASPNARGILEIAGRASSPTAASSSPWKTCITITFDIEVSPRFSRLHALTMGVQIPVNLVTLPPPRSYDPNLNACVSMAHLPTTMPREEAQDVIAPRTVICELRA